MTFYVASFISSFVTEGGETLTYVCQTPKRSILSRSTHCLINFFSTYVLFLFWRNSPNHQLVAETSA